ncbi:hypothetical protein [Thermincola potens]|uniref:hypothetical protein n=1 Tax=Thermincola potens TaxID=863643 RepID=UPI00059F20CA|nr:hypothetical protein [Thermincola potens]
MKHFRTLAAVLVEGWGGVLRLPFGSDCARKAAAGQAEGSRMSEDGEGRREVRHSNWLSGPDGRRPNLLEMQYEPSSSGTLPAGPGFAAPSSLVTEDPTHPSLIGKT